MSVSRASVSLMLKPGTYSYFCQQPSLVGQLFSSQARFNHGNKTHDRNDFLQFHAPCVGMVLTVWRTRSIMPASGHRGGGMTTVCQLELKLKESSWRRRQRQLDAAALLDLHAAHTPLETLLASTHSARCTQASPIKLDHFSCRLSHTYCFLLAQ